LTVNLSRNFDKNHFVLIAGQAVNFLAVCLQKFFFTPHTVPEVISVILSYTDSSILIELSQFLSVDI